MTDEQTLQFIDSHRDDDPRRLALQHAGRTDIDLPYALCQIAGWQTARQKMPTWAECHEIAYPPHLSMEQCSSEHTARYKADLCRRLLADRLAQATLVDLTGGLGVDFSFMAPAFRHSVYVERQETLCSMARHNLPLLGLQEAEVWCADSQTALHKVTAADMFFIDPARRDTHGARTYAIADCTPDVPALLPALMEKATWTMVKLSPMLDWHKAVADLTVCPMAHVAEIHIVAVANECKELLVVLSRQTTADIALHCRNHPHHFATTVSDVEQQVSTTPWPTVDECLQARYLYEPNAAIMKAGCFTMLSQRWPIAPLATNSHLFVGTEPLSDFPGRAFEVLRATTTNKRQLRDFAAEYPQANITVRNFPLTAQQLRQKLKVKDGGPHYLFASTAHDGTHLLFACRKTQN